MLQNSMYLQFSGWSGPDFVHNRILHSSEYSYKGDFRHSNQFCPWHLFISSEWLDWVTPLHFVVLDGWLPDLGPLTQWWHWPHCNSSYRDMAPWLWHCQQVSVLTQNSISHDFLLSILSKQAYIESDYCLFCFSQSISNILESKCMIPLCMS